MTACFDGLGWGDIYPGACSAANYRLRTIAGGRWTDHCRPTDIAFLMTALCNAKCCAFRYLEEPGQERYPSLEQY